jgi:hypothetical protein
MSSNDIGAQGACAIAKALERNKSINALGSVLGPFALIVRKVSLSAFSLQSLSLSLSICFKPHVTLPNCHL